LNALPTPVTVASGGCIAELVDERYRPVLPGTPAARVLVTNPLQPRPAADQVKLRRFIPV